MFCTNCGTKLVEGGKFCPSCGSETTTPKADSPREIDPAPNKPAAKTNKEPAPVDALDKTGPAPITEDSASATEASSKPVNRKSSIAIAVVVGVLAIVGISVAIGQATPLSHDELVAKANSAIESETKLFDSSRYWGKSAERGQLGMCLDDLKVQVAKPDNDAKLLETLQTCENRAKAMGSVPSASVIEANKAASDAAEAKAKADSAANAAALAAVAADTANKSSLLQIMVDAIPSHCNNTMPGGPGQQITVVFNRKDGGDYLFTFSLTSAPNSPVLTLRAKDAGTNWKVVNQMDSPGVGEGPFQCTGFTTKK